MTHPTFGLLPGQSPFQPRSTDDADGTTAGTVLVHVATRSTAGLGSMAAVPAGSANGTPLGPVPTGAVGVRFYLPAGASVTYTIAGTQPQAAPSAAFTAQQSGAAPSTFDEQLSAGQQLFVTATNGAPVFRWL